MHDQHIGIIGAGFIGLCTALHLQQKGYKVTLIDKAEPGMGASYGNAGLFADYARLPLARYALLGKLPGMLLDSESPLSIHPGYLPELTPFGWHFVRSCRDSRVEQSKARLTQLQQLAPAADDAMFNLTNANELVRAEGCLGLFTSQQGLKTARLRDLAERQQQGVNMQFLTADQVRELEPALCDFHSGGVYYPDTRFTVTPLALSQRYLKHFIHQGGTLMHDEVSRLSPSPGQTTLALSTTELTVNHTVICGGVATRKLIKPLGISIPLVSERGYHLGIDFTGQQLARPVGWLDKGVFLTPMADGIRLAGIAEFARPEAPANEQRVNTMLRHARTMLGPDTGERTRWVGSRPSSPDSLPFMGQLSRYPGISVACGHGHLGLTLSALTGKLISEQISGHTPSIDLAPFAVERFS